MNRRLLGWGGILVIIFTLIYVFRPAGHVRLFDADFTPLAETELEGYCGGRTYWQTNGAGDSYAAQGCRDDYAGTKSESVNLTRVLPGFCQGVIDEGWNGDESTCLDILTSQRLWPTLDGALSQAWNRRQPYPLDTIVISSGDDSQSRTGERQPPGRVVADRSENDTVYGEPSPEASSTASPSPETSPTEEEST